MTDYLGGNRQTMGEIADRARRVLGPLPKVELGWPYQCRCGSTVWVKYRGRFYSPCGIRWPADQALAGHPTLREAYGHAVHKKVGPAMSFPVRPEGYHLEMYVVTSPSAALSGPDRYDCGIKVYDNADDSLIYEGHEFADPIEAVAEAAHAIEQWWEQDS